MHLRSIVHWLWIVKSAKHIITKKGDRMAFLHVEDKSSKAEVIVFPQLFKKVESWLNQYQVFIIKATVDLTSTQQCKLKAQELVPIELFFQEWSSIQGALLQLPPHVDISFIDTLRTTLVTGSIPLQFLFYEHNKKLLLKTKQMIAIDLPTIKELEKQSVRVRLTVK